MPLNPQIISAENAQAALHDYRQKLAERSGETAPTFERIVWGEGIESGVDHDLEVVRKDRLLSREHWQFGDRIEYIALASQGEQ